MDADLLVYNAAQVLTVASPGGPKRGAAMGDLGIFPTGRWRCAMGGCWR